MKCLQVDHFGRRILLIVSGTFMTLSLSGLGTFLYLKSNSDIEQLDDLGWIPLCCLILYVVAFSVGYGAIPFLIMGELFPLQYRHLMSTFSTSFNLTCSFLVVRTFPDLIKALGIYGTFGLYATCSIFGVIFVIICLPETKGRTLQEISLFFTRPTNQLVSAVWIQ